MKKLLLAIALVVGLSGYATQKPALAWTYQECLGPNGQIDVAISPDCAQYAPPPPPTPKPVYTPAPTPKPAPPTNSNSNTNNNSNNNANSNTNKNSNTNTNNNTNTQHQNQSQNQSQGQSQSTRVTVSPTIRNNVKNDVSATGGTSSATGGTAVSGVNLLPGAVQGGSVAAGAAQSSVSNNVYSGGYAAPMTPAVAPLADCHSSAALTAGIQVQGTNGGFLYNGTTVGGFAGVSIPIGRRAPECYVVPVAAVAQPPVIVNVQAAAPVAAPAPTIQYVPQPYAVPQPHLYVVNRQVCSPMTAQRRAYLLNKKNPHGVYMLARTYKRHELKAVIDELTRACVDFSNALDG